MNIGRRINMSEHVCLTWSLKRSFWSAWILLTGRKKTCEILWNIHVNIKCRTTYKHVWTCLNMSVWLEVQKDPFHRFRFLLTWSRKKKSCWCVLHPGRRLEFQSATHNVLCMGPKLFWSCIKITAVLVFDEIFSKHSVFANASTCGPRSS